MILADFNIYKTTCMFKYIQNYLNRFPKRKICYSGKSFFICNYGSLHLKTVRNRECFSLLVLECLRGFTFLSLVSRVWWFFCSFAEKQPLIMLSAVMFLWFNVNIQGQIISHKHTSPVLWWKIISQRAADPLEDEIERNCGHMLPTCIHYTSWLHVIQERPNRCKIAVSE